MLARSCAAHTWLGVLLPQAQGIAACTSSLLSCGVCGRAGSFAGVPTQYSPHHTSSCSSSSQAGGPSSTDTAAAPVAESNSTGSTPTGSKNPSSAAAATAAVAHQQVHKPAIVTPDGFATLQQRSTATGYPETLVPANAQELAKPSSSKPEQQQQQQHNKGKQRAERVVADVVLPPETLRIPLRQETKEAAAEVQVDAYSLSRSLVSDFSPTAAAAEQQQQQQHLTAADKEALEKLVGILTKDGKKSRARRLLLDAMHIIKQQLAKGHSTA